MLLILEGYLSKDANIPHQSMAQAQRHHCNCHSQQGLCFVGGLRTPSQPLRFNPTPFETIHLDVLNDSGVHGLLESISAIHIEGVTGVLL